MAKKRGKFIDDGRVIAPMNIEGMPWYTPKRASHGDEMCQGDGSADTFVCQGDGSADTFSAAFPAKMTRGENIAFSFGVLKAVLLVSVVFIGVLFLFILFCTNVWLK